MIQVIDRTQQMHHFPEVKTGNFLLYSNELLATLLKIVRINSHLTGGGIQR